MPDQTTPPNQEDLWSQVQSLLLSGRREAAKLVVLGMPPDQTEPPPQPEPPTTGDSPSAPPGGKSARTAWMVGVPLAAIVAIGLLVWAWRALAPTGEGESPGLGWGGSSRFAPISISPPLAASQPILRPPGETFIAFGNTRMMHALHAESPPTLDGVLNPGEWDRATRFRASLPAPHGDRYYIEGYLKCDDDFLYIAAHVGDPIPLKNPTDPNPITDDAARAAVIQNGVSVGGAVSVHLSSIRDPEKDANTRRIDMWAFNNVATNTPEPRLVIYKGTAGTNPEQPPKFNEDDGSRGAFTRDEDNLGYSLEYGIKWSDLWEGADPPADGTERAICWDVRWSDETGTKLLAKLSDVLNPDEARQLEPATFHPYAPPARGPILSYEHPELWGRATFHRK